MCVCVRVCEKITLAWPRYSSVSRIFSYTWPSLGVRIFSRESKYEIRVLRVATRVKKILYTVTQKNERLRGKSYQNCEKKRLKLDLARANGRTAEKRPPKTNQPKSIDSCYVLPKKYDLK